MSETRGETVTMPELDETLFDISDCCEDCPDVNLDPPASSDCPYFDLRDGIPVCTRPDGLERFIGGGRTDTGIAGMACGKALEIADTNITISPTEQ